MPNVAEELAALRAKGAVKTHASELSVKTSSGGGGAGLSTPEAEAAALKSKRENDKRGTVAAKEMLNRGSKGASVADLAELADFKARKREDQERKARASEILRGGGTGGGYSQEIEHSLSQTGRKRADREKKDETKREMATQAGGSEKADGRKSAAAATATAKQVRSEATEKESTIVPSEKVEPIENDDEVPDLEDSDDAIPELETATANVSQQPMEKPDVAGGGEGESQERQVTNRNEKKARKMMTRLGMRPVANITRVTLKAGGGRGFFFIDRPDVFASVGGRGDTFVLFGQARQGGSSGAGAAQAQQQAAMAQQQAAMAAAAAGGETAGMPSVQEEGGAEDVPELEEGGGTPSDEEGLDVKDIELVMGQASCSRTKAVAALKENDGDLVNAIMSLTT